MDRRVTKIEVGFRQGGTGLYSLKAVIEHVEKLTKGDAIVVTRRWTTPNVGSSTTILTKMSANWLFQEAEPWDSVFTKLSDKNANPDKVVLFVGDGGSNDQPGIGDLKYL